MHCKGLLQRGPRRDGRDCRGYHRYGYCCKDVTREEIAWLKTLGTDVYFDLLYTKITREKVELALEHGVNVEAWIINDFESIIRLSEMGVTGFTTDYYMLDNCIF